MFCMQALRGVSSGDGSKTAFVSFLGLSSNLGNSPDKNRADLISYLCVQNKHSGARACCHFRGVRTQGQMHNPAEQRADHSA